jgi:hypothetical protein
MMHREEQMNVVGCRHQVLMQAATDTLRSHELKRDYSNMYCLMLVGHSEKNDLSMEVLRDFCPRETFLRSVPVLYRVLSYIAFPGFVHNRY